MAGLLVVGHPTGRNGDDDRRAGEPVRSSSGWRRIFLLWEIQYRLSRCRLWLYGAAAGETQGRFFVEFGLECMARQCV